MTREDLLHALQAQLALRDLASQDDPAPAGVTAELHVRPWSVLVRVEQADSAPREFEVFRDVKGRWLLLDDRTMRLFARWSPEEFDPRVLLQTIMSCCGL